MRYQLTYRRKNGLCASNLIKDPKSNEKCEYKDYLLDKTAENTLVLSEMTMFISMEKNESQQKMQMEHKLI